MFKQLGHQVGLRVNQLEFIALIEHHIGALFGAHAHPIDALRRPEGTVGFNGDGEILSFQRCDQRRIELQEWFTARADDKAVPT